MLLMEDEVRRTQQGNNNAYCQDNEISWFDWNLCHRNADLLRFVRNMIRLRLNFNQGTKAGQITLEDYLSKARIEWHGVHLGKPDWERDLPQRRAHSAQHRREPGTLHCDQRLLPAARV